MHVFRRAVVLSLVLALTSGAPGLTPYRAAAAVGAPTRGARVTSPALATGAIDGARVFSPLLLPSGALLSASNLAPSHALLAPAVAPAVWTVPADAPAAPLATAKPGEGVAPAGVLETLEHGAAEVIRERAEQPAGIPALDSLYERRAARADSASGAKLVVLADEPQSDGSAAGLGAADAPAQARPAGAAPASPTRSAAAPSLGGSWLPSPFYARYVGWWLQPAAAVSAGSWLHGALVGAGYAGDFTLNGGSLSIAWTAAVFGAGSLAAFAAPRLLVSLLTRRQVLSGGAAFQTATAFGVAALYGLALAVPLGAGLPSMLLAGGALAAFLGWVVAGAVAGRRRFAAAKSADRYRLIAYVLAAAAPLALVADHFGLAPLTSVWLGTFAMALTLFLDLLFAAPVALVRWTWSRVRGGPPVEEDPSRRRFLTGFSAVSVFGLAGGVGAAVATALGRDWDRKIDHIRPNLGYDSFYDRPRGEEEPSLTKDEHWRRLENALDALRGGGLSVEEAVAAAGVVNRSVGRVHVDPHRYGRSYEYGDEDYLFPRTIPDLRTLEQRRLQRLEEFLLDTQVVRAPSAAARELIVDAKRRILDLLFEGTRERPAQARALVERLLPLARYEEKLYAPDPSYPSFGFTETERLSLALRVNFFAKAQRREAASVLTSAGIDERERDGHEKRYDAIRSVLRSWLLTDTLAEEQALLRLAEAERVATVHALPLSFAGRAREARGWPKVVLTALTESANAHGLAPELLAANLTEQVERRYTISEGFRVFADRQDEKASFGRLKAQVGRWLAKRAPREVSLPVSWNDFIGGVVLSGKNGIGLFQIRPANVRRFPGVWKRFGVADAGVLSDREISYRLHDSRYNAEAWTVILMDGLGREVEELGRQARAGGKLDFSAYESESRNWLRPMEKETYALLPPASTLGRDGWRLGQFHPLLADKARIRVEASINLRASGLFDQRPAVFTGARDSRDVVKLAELLSDRDPFFSGAARRALEALAVGDGPLKAEAVKALQRPSAPAAHAALDAKLALGAVVIAGAVQVAQANPLLSRRRLLGRRD